MTPSEINQEVEAAHAQLEELHINGVEGRSPGEVGLIVGTALATIMKHGAMCDATDIIKIVQARSLQTLRHTRHAVAVVQ